MATLRRIAVWSMLLGACTSSTTDEPTATPAPTVPTTSHVAAAPPITQPTITQPTITQPTLDTATADAPTAATDGTSILLPGVDPAAAQRFDAHLLATEAPVVAEMDGTLDVQEILALTEDGVRLVLPLPDGSVWRVRTISSKSSVSPEAAELTMAISSPSGDSLGTLVFMASPSFGSGHVQMHGGQVAFFEIIGTGFDDGNFVRIAQLDSEEVLRAVNGSAPTYLPTSEAPPSSSP